MAKAFAFQFCKRWQMVRQIALLQTQMGKIIPGMGLENKIYNSQMG
jgi:hypothetical protein